MMAEMPRALSVSLALIACLTPQWLAAQDVFLDGWRDAKRAQASDLTLGVSTPKQVYFLGELIPLKLTFTSSESTGYLADSNVRGCSKGPSTREKFIVDPLGATKDPLQGVDLTTGAILCTESGTSPLRSLSVEPLLNESVRFMKPGTYRIYVVSDGRVQRMNGTVTPLVSNVVTLELRDTPPEWAAEQLADAVKVLDAPYSGRMANDLNRARAANVLRFLYTPEAAAEVGRRQNAGDLPGPEYWPLRLAWLSWQNGNR
jgi:hypothetical protein